MYFDNLIQNGGDFVNLRNQLLTRASTGHDDSKNSCFLKQSIKWRDLSDNF